MSDSYISHKDNVIKAYVGKEATLVVRAIALKGALRMSLIGMKLARNQPTMAAIKAEVEQITGKRFKRSEKQEMMDALDAHVASEKQRLGREE